MLGTKCRMGTDIWFSYGITRHFPPYELFIELGSHSRESINMSHWLQSESTINIFLLMKEHNSNNNS